MRKIFLLFPDRYMQAARLGDHIRNLDTVNRDILPMIHNHLRRNPNVFAFLQVLQATLLFLLSLYCAKWHGMCKKVFH